jgi:hypothetical protein
MYQRGIEDTFVMSTIENEKFGEVNWFIVKGKNWERRNRYLEIF